jgi:hypothetical protein
MKCQARNRDGKECGYEWAPRKVGVVPKECPECKSRKWQGTGGSAIEAEVKVPGVSKPAKRGDFGAALKEAIGGPVRSLGEDRVAAAPRASAGKKGGPSDEEILKMTNSERQEWIRRQG